MTNTRDRKHRPLTHAILTRAISRITRIVLAWLSDYMHH
jgi:hypothetical protein